MKKFKPVDSSTVAEVFYDMSAATESGKLYLRFKGKGSKLYSYDDVPKTLVLAFMDAPSKGKFVNKYIAPHYKTTRHPTDMMLDGTVAEEEYDAHGLPIAKNNPKPIKVPQPKEPKPEREKPVIRTGTVEL